MSLANLEGAQTDRNGARIQRLQRWPILMLLAAGLTAAHREEHCEAASATEAASHSYSLLQVSKPRRGVRDKVQLRLTVEDSEERRTAIPIGKKTAAPQLSERMQSFGDQGLSFFQVAESVSEESPKAATNTAPAITINGAESVLEKAFGKASEVHVAWWRGFLDAAMIITVAASVTWIVFLLTGRCNRVKWFNRNRVSPHLVVLPTPQGTLTAPLARSTAASTPSALREPLFPETGVSFAIPLTHHTEAGSSSGLSFHIPRRPDGPPVFATVRCAPDHNSWAKIEVTAGEFGGSAPLATCSLVQCASDDESRHIQGAMLSWLSLLLHEKSAEEAAFTEKEDKQARMAQISRVCLHGMAEDLAHVGLGLAGSQGLHLEVQDGMGASLGRLEPGTNLDQYALVKQGKPQLEIQVEPNSRDLTLSKHGQVCARASKLSGKRDPEDPELTGEEDEYLQVDIRSGSKWPEIALLLTCVLAMIVFKPEASMVKDDDRHGEHPERIVLTSPADGPKPASTL